VQKVSHKRIFLALLAFMKLIYVHRLRGLRKGLKIRKFEDCKWPKQFIFPKELILLIQRVDFLSQFLLHFKGVFIDS